MKVRLLHRDRDLDMSQPIAAHRNQPVEDLQLDTLVDAACDGDTLVGDVTRRVLLDSLADPDPILYRQAILADFIDQPQMLFELYRAAADALDARRGVWGYGYSTFRTPSGILSGATRYLHAYLDHLQRLRVLADTHRPTCRSEGLTNLFETIRAELDGLYFRTVERQLRRLQFDNGILLSAQLGPGNLGDAYVLRSPGSRPARWKQRLRLASPTTYSFSIDPRDDGGAQALEELTSRGLNQVANAAAKSADHITGYFTLLRSELAFYVGCLRVHDRLTSAGQRVCLPEIASSSESALSFRDLRHPALSLAGTGPVWGHDADGDGRTVLVVTGANSGGKTTFLRSVGVAQLMMQAGMFVTASSFRASLCSGVFTHFAGSEDRTMNRGRLEQELARMASLAPQLQPGAMVLFNESFHSTNEREGSEISRQIVRALRDTGHRVVFVTHQYDFAHSFADPRRSDTLFLRAEPPGAGLGGYRLIQAPPLPSAYGPELYHSVFGEQPP